MRTLLNVSDKEGIVESGKELEDLGSKLLSAGGTFKFLRENGVKVVEVSEFTKSPELFEGHVKTLHLKIHDGILYKESDESRIKQAKENGILDIGLVCVNLYPFKETTIMSGDFDEVTENIDIGDPAMIRSAAKNYKDMMVLCDPLDYEKTIGALKKSENGEKFRLNLMIKTCEHTANHDVYIANYMDEEFNRGSRASKFMVGQKVSDTRCGEDPYQKGALYGFDAFFSINFRALKGEASFNNPTNINTALNLAGSFDKTPAIAIVKHDDPCDFAIKENLVQSYIHALKRDSISACGGVIAVSGALDEVLTNKISGTYVEVIIMANIDEKALAIFRGKKRVKILAQESPYLIGSFDGYDFKHIGGGFVYQSSDEVGEDELKNTEFVSQREASQVEIQDLEIAMEVAALTKSNSVIYVKSGVMVAIGMGMASRIDAAEAAIAKAEEMGLDLQGYVLVSETFFPSRDSIDEASKVEVKVIVEPGGSARDDEVIRAASEYDTALYFTGMRHFLH